LSGSSRAPAEQAQGPEFRLQYHQKQVTHDKNAGGVAQAVKSACLASVEALSSNPVLPKKTRLVKEK
jgi:hypothetical protein